jgi:hypothetical protein
MALIEYTPPPTVDRFLQSKAVLRGIMGPLGSGKSVGCVMALVKNALEQEPDEHGIRHSRFAIVRNTYRMLKDTTLNTVLDWLPDGVAGRWYAGDMKFVLKFGDVESTWLFRALDKPDDVRNLLSLEITSAWINEYREIDPKVLSALIGRIGRFPGGKRSRMRSVVMDTNPPPVGSFWHEIFEEGIDPAVQKALDSVLKDTPDGERPLMEHFKQPGGRDPNAENLEHLPDGYYEVLMATNKDEGEDWVKVHVDAQYGPDPSNLPVYPQYRADLHAPDDFPYRLVPEATSYIGMDFGKTPAAVLLQQLPNDRWVVFSELVTENCVTEEFVPKVDAWLERLGVAKKYVRVYGDPAGGYQHEIDRKTSFQVLRDAGYTVLAGERAPQRRLGSIRRLLSTLIDGAPALMVNKHECPMLHRGFVGEYKYKRNQEGEANPEPRKNKFSHPHDGLQHLLGRVHRMAGGKPQDTIVKQKPWDVYAA